MKQGRNHCVMIENQTKLNQTKPCQYSFGMLTTQDDLKIDSVVCQCTKFGKYDNYHES